MIRVENLFNCHDPDAFEAGFRRLSSIEQAEVCRLSDELDLEQEAWLLGILTKDEALKRLETVIQPAPPASTDSAT